MYASDNGNCVKDTTPMTTPQTPQDVLHLFFDRLATTMYLMRSTISTVLKGSPQALAFSCDMLLNILLIAEWQTITPNREALVNDALLKNNQRCINYIILLDKESLNMITQPKGNFTFKTSSPFEWYHHNTIIDWCDRMNQHPLHYPF